MGKPTSVSNAGFIHYLKTDDNGNLCKAAVHIDNAQVREAVVNGLHDFIGEENCEKILNHLNAVCAGHSDVSPLAPSSLIINAQLAAPAVDKAVAAAACWTV